MEETLKDIFLNVNDWLKFLESKNAVLVALNGAAILGVLEFIKDIESSSYLLTLYLCSFVICVGIGLVISLFSFLPQTKIPYVWRNDIIRDSDNLLFWGDIKKYDAITYLRNLYKNCGQDDNKYSRLELNYANQIIINAKIISRKSSCFKSALWFTLAGVLTPLVGALTYLIFNPNE